MKKTLLAGLASCTLLTASAQQYPVPPGPGLDPDAVRLLAQDPATYVADEEPYVSGLNPIREQDIAWQKRVWRRIDLNDPANALLRQPALQKSLVQTLIDGVRNGEIKAYPSSGDKPDYVADLTPGRFERLLGGCTDDPARPGFCPERVTAFKVLESWCYLAREGRLVVRIVAIAPIVAGTGNTPYLGGEPAFWMPYLQTYKYLAAQPVHGAQDGWLDNLDKVLNRRAYSGTVIRWEVHENFSFAGR